MNKPLVSIVILTYNGKKNLELCLPSIQKLDYPRFEIILVDNGSTDNSLEFVRRKFPKVQIVRNSKNLGYAVGNNQGVGKARGKYVLFLNDDTTHMKDFLTKLVGVMEADRTIGAAQSLILSMDDPNTIDSAGSFFTKAGIQEHLSKMPVGSLEAPSEIFGAKTACTLVRCDIFKKIGGFDKDYFVYFVDPDLSWRIWQVGFRVVLAPDSIIYHKGGTTNVYLGSGFVVYQSFKNRIDSLIKNLEPSLMLILGIHIFVLLMGSILFIIRLKPKNSLAIWRAIIFNLLNLNKTLRKRTRVQKLRNLGDKEIFERTGKPISLKYFWSGALEYTKEW